MENLNMIVRAVQFGELGDETEVATAGFDPARNKSKDFNDR